MGKERRVILFQFPKDFPAKCVHAREGNRQRQKMNDQECKKDEGQVSERVAERRTKGTKGGDMSEKMQLYKYWSQFLYRSKDMTRRCWGVLWLGSFVPRLFLSLSHSLCHSDWSRLSSERHNFPQPGWGCNTLERLRMNNCRSFRLPAFVKRRIAPESAMWLLLQRFGAIFPLFLFFSLRRRGKRRLEEDMFSVSLKCRLGVIKRRIKGNVQCITLTLYFGRGVWISQHVGRGTSLRISVLCKILFTDLLVLVWGRKLM